MTQNYDTLLLHGLWLHGPTLAPLARHLALSGFRPKIFGYFSVLESTEQVLARLTREIQNNPSVHLVGHSLGGLLSLKASHTSEHTGRVVCLGSPVNGSQVARNLSPNTLGAGMRRHHGLLSEGVRPHLRAGMIAGSKPIGLGQFFADFDENDGTVGLLETQHHDFGDHTVIKASHTGLIYSFDAWNHTAHFLQHGNFNPSGWPC